MSSNVNPLTRRGIITLDYLMETGIKAEQDLKRWLLLYDEFWIPGLASRLSEWQNFEMEDDEMVRRLADLEWLVSMQQLVELPVNINTDLNQEDELINELTQVNEEAWADLGKTYETPEEAAKAAVAAQFNIEIATSRMMTYLLWKEQELIVYPIVFPYDNALPGYEVINKRQNVLSVVLDQLPEPSENLPLKDIIDYKTDDETKEKYHNLWKWITKVAKNDQANAELREEIASLLEEYSNHLRRFTTYTSLTKIETVVNTISELPKNILTLNFGKFANTGIEIKKRSINAITDELRLPGSEVAYIKEVSGFLRNQE